MTNDSIEFSHRKFSINCQGELIDLTTPQIMGILNLTPDSFSDGGKYNTVEAALRQTEKLISDGATIIDIGPQSTRLGAEKLSAQEEIKRIGNIIGQIKREFPGVLVSVDTFWAETVKACFNEGVDIINDISAGQFDPEMFKAAGETRLPYILMHVNPTYESMHEKVDFDSICVKVNKFLFEKAKELENLGINDIILDPGFGFGKSISDQQELIQQVQHIGFGKYPTLIGISRKSFIYKPLNKGPLEINQETQKLHRLVLEQGAKILRVHDAKMAKQTLDQFLLDYPIN